MVNTDWISKPSGITKCVTLLVNIVCIALLSKYGVYGNSIEKIIMIVTATGGCILVDIVLLVGYVAESTHGKAKLQEVVAAVISAVMVLTAGALVIDVVIDYKRSNETIDAQKAYGALSIINAIIYAGTAFLAYTGK